MASASADRELPAYDPQAPGATWPGHLTDALVCASITVRERHAGYTVVRCPGNPAFRFGNLLMLDNEPPLAQVDGWFARYEAAFANVPVKRRVIAWEVPLAAPVPAFGAGTDSAVMQQCSTVLAARRVPARGPRPATIRPLESDADWSVALELFLADAAVAGSGSDFARWRFGIVRADARAGRCRVWGAHGDANHGASLVAFAALYADTRWARFFTPVTAEVCRRQGVFRALASMAIADALERFPRCTVVIVAEAGSCNEAIYTRLGFEPVSRQLALVAPALDASRA